MEVQPINQSPQPQQRASVTVSPNPVRVRELLDKDGNVIDPRTKQIIRKNEN